MNNEVKEYDVRYFNCVPFCLYCTYYWGPVGFINMKNKKVIYWVEGIQKNPIRFFPDYGFVKEEHKEYQEALKSDERFSKDQVLDKVMKKAQREGFEDLEYIKYIVEWLFKE